MILEGVGLYGIIGIVSAATLAQGQRQHNSKDHSDEEEDAKPNKDRLLVLLVECLVLVRVSSY